MSKYQEIIDKTTEELKKYYDLDNMTKDQAKLLYGDVTYTTELLTAVLMKIRVGDILEETDGEPNYTEDLYRSKAMLYCGMIVLDTLRANLIMAMMMKNSVKIFSICYPHCWESMIFRQVLIMLYTI